MDSKKIAISGIAAGFVFYILYMILAIIITAIPGLAYDPATLDGMRPMDSVLMSLFMLFPFVISFTMAIAYEQLKPAFSKDFVRNGIQYGFMIWIVAGIPSIFIVFTSMSYPLGFNLTQIIGYAVSYIGAGIVTAKLME
ncbi:MAG: hypothetical protein ABID38_02960 [Candidatus Diapherotrites archaeon]